ncbi:hypothetical protein N7462_003732 [Penicillium macrosclerotiorum]|uniref:uncharacterized protein n=1 Tax=Penicillium macrosclerotiorum TaxID=303699 RepID=UPI0025468980|nr:uncharacterized protein N7462_003732 [Penicillium macrosclerotiorum]KAJ5689340.1 hypothetical protein N7462_003732 [Penicillium macrosclerotiorum]
MAGYQRHEDLSSSSVTSITMVSVPDLVSQSDPLFPAVRIPALQPDPSCDPSHQADPASIALPPSPCLSPPATMSVPIASSAPADPNVGQGEFDGSARSSPKLLAKSSGHKPALPSMVPTMPIFPKDDAGLQVSFEDFATRYRQSQRKQAQRKRLEERLRATKVSIGVSARMIRVGNAVQRGLVEALKHDDKINFVAIYHMMYDLQDSCAQSARCDEHQDLPNDQEQPSDRELDRSSDFFNQLSPQSRADLLEILRLVRSDPQFLVDRLRSFTSAQLTALTSPSTTLESGDPAFPSSRSRSQYAFSRNPVQSTSFKDHAYAFERTDPLSILLCNVFAAPLEHETPEARLRLDVWSTVCAQLMSHGSSKFYPLIGQILSSWSTGSNWKARPKFELYLMDILQTGAFLLEHIETPAGLGSAAEALDPLRTDAAEEFFASAVDDLFRVLDDADGGFPRAVLQFAKAVLQKLETLDSRSRFLEYLFVQWFFPKFLYSTLTYPETHGLLLDFHIRKDAREKLLGQVGLRAYSQVFAVLRSMHHYSILRPSIKQHVDNMLARFQSTVPSEPYTAELSAQAESAPRRDSSSTFLLLSATDVLTLLDALFPQTCSSLHSSPVCASVPSWSSNLSPTNSLRHEPLFEPGFFRSTYETLPRPTSQNGSIFSMDSSFSLPENGLSQTAARIRFELTDLDEPTERARLEHPSVEHWTIFSVAQDGLALTWSLLPDYGGELSRQSAVESDDDTHSTNLGLEENHEALQTAIIRLVRENHVYDSEYCDRQSPAVTLKQRFNQAMSASHNYSDFVGAHYWWNASRQLRQGMDSSQAAGDSWILGPMHNSCARSLSKSRTIIERCESDFVSLDQSLRQLQSRVKQMMTTITKIRNKMWYMTDVKNSMRYEEARHVAMALKTMIYSARPYTEVPEDTRSRSGARSLGGSLFQKPELQVMNMMKAPSSQGGPKKLSDEQVELTRKWLAHNGIENFCKGEERIHRFCYEVRTSITRLVGETMSETPVLWASELFQRERLRYEGYGSRGFPGFSLPTTPRPSTTASEDPTQSQLHGLNIPLPDSLSRLSQDLPSLGRKSSIQSLISDKYRAPRDVPSADMSSIGGSPGRAASTSTGDTSSTFWSVPQRHPMYAASVSSVYSRPPSMFSETATRQPHRPERKTHGKAAFMDDLRQTLTSLLLSDLGSPVWSCGSETDAWFTNALEQPRIRVQMQRRAAIDKFYAEYDARSKHLRENRPPRGRRSRSLDGSHQSKRKSPRTDTLNAEDVQFQSDDQSSFSYKSIFHQLIEVFSRHGNPFIKLNALRDLRSLVVASLNSPHDQISSASAANPSSTPAEGARMRNSVSLPRQRSIRHSFSECHATRANQMNTNLPMPSPPQSVTCGSRRSEYATPSENQIVAALRDLILEVKPKTLFRDLQFISAFVPGDQLSKTDRGTAFLQFGLAALSLKDEVCLSMIDIADRIVSQELMRRHPLPGSDFYPRPGHAIEDAAAMWIITAKEGNPVAQRELAILYLTHPELLPRVTLPLTRPRDTFKAEMMYRRGKDSKSDPQSMCLALHWMQLSASGGDLLARNRLREREEFDSIA